MFLDELTPIVKELAQQPVAFLGGFFSGILRLKLSDDPLKNWLQKQGISPSAYSTDNSERGSGPQTISID